MLSLLLGSCGPPRLPVPSIAPPAEDEEAKISREFRREAKKHLQFVNNPEVERYIDNIGRRILSAMGPQPFDYRFFVIDDSQLNAFAVPGGSIYFYTGLIERAKSDSEIAGVMGHELVHIKGRHMARSSGPDAVSILSLLGSLLLARSGSGAQAAGAVGQAIAATRQIAYSRQLEMEADTLGVRYMAQAGYDPNASVGFLKMLDQERTLSPIDIPPYMMTHPVTKERIANVELVIRSLGKSEFKSNDFDDLRRIQTILRIERREGVKVIEEYSKRVRNNPEDAATLHLLALAYHLNGDLSEARKYYEKSQQLNPTPPTLNRDLGRLYTELREYELARTSFERAIAADAKESLTFFYLGDLYENAGDLRAAAGAFLNAHNLAPQWDKPPGRLGVVYGKLNRLGDAHYYLGRALLLQDEEQKAIVEYEKSIRVFGANSPRGQLIGEELKEIRARARH